jgi:hypothetical protein
MARLCEARGGRTAALLAIALSLTCLGVVQFIPGRIDHHNAIILCTVIGILLLARSFDTPDAGWGAGVLLGLGTAIGFESIALTTAALGAGVLYGLLPGRSLLGPSRTAVTFAATLATAFAATTAPDNFLVVHCDALSINIVVLAAIGAIGVCAVQALEHRLSAAAKLVLLAVTGAVGVALYGQFEPACLRGPFAQVDPAANAMWLSTVLETQSLLSFGEALPVTFLMAGAYFAAGLYFGIKLMRVDRGDEIRFLVLALAMAIPLSCWQIKLIPYATYLAVPLIALGLAWPSPTPRPRPAGRRLSLIEVLALLAMAGVGWGLFVLAKPSEKRVKEALAPMRSCLESSAYRPLAALPRGLAVADVNLGPYLVALTNLDALSAPYHRIGKSIVEAHEILHSAPAEAERRLREAGASYVVICPGADSTKSPTPSPADALQTLLLDGKPPSYLTQVPLAQPTPLKVWRVSP